MAKATRVTKTVKVVKTYEIDEVVNDGINLHLSEEEAKVLHRIFGHDILGPDTGPRGITNRIWFELGQFVASKSTDVKSKGALYIE